MVLTFYIKWLLGQPAAGSEHKPIDAHAGVRATCAVALLHPHAQAPRTPRRARLP